MDTHIISQQNMQAMEKLASTNLEVSNARNALFKMKEDETSYINEREKRTLERIAKLLDDSEEILNKTKNNYAELDDLLNTVSGVAKFITEAQGNFHQMIQDFEERDVLWQAKVAKHESELKETLKSIQIREVFLANEKKNIEKSKLILSEEKKKIDDKWAEIARELKRLKK